MSEQRLHLVFGGELIDTRSRVFRDPEAIHVVGIFSDYEKAFAAWRTEAQRTVDSAGTRYFIAHLHALHDETREAGPTGEFGA